MNTLPRTAAILLALAPAVAVALLARPAVAQVQNNVPNALQGFAANRDQPIQIDANSLEVMDQEKKAVFSGNVVVKQGDTTMHSKELVVFYDGKDGPAAAAAPTPGNPISSSAIRRLEINGGVVVNTKEQTATGDQGVFETKSNSITLSGNPVVLTSGPNVIRGKRLVVDLTTGTSRFEGGRVQSLIVPGSMKQMEGGAPKPGAAPAKPAPKP